MSKTPCPLLKNSRKSLGCPWRYIIYSSYITCFYIPRSFLILHKRSQPMPNILHPPSLLRRVTRLPGMHVLSCPVLSWSDLKFQLFSSLSAVFSQDELCKCLVIVANVWSKRSPCWLVGEHGAMALSWTFLLLLQNMVSLSCHLFPPVLYLDTDLFYLVKSEAKGLKFVKLKCIQFIVAFRNYLILVNSNYENCVWH